MGRTCVFDLEGNALYNDITTIWCGVFYDLDTDEFISFKPDQIQEMLEFMSACSTLIGHNVINFDFEALRKLYGFKYTGHVVDTFILSQLFNPDRYGGHSVAAWAKQLELKQQKVEHEDWSRYTPEMLHRCHTDVVIQTEVYRALLKENKPDKATHVDWTLPISLEHDIASIIAKQEHDGVPFNMTKAVEYYATLSNLLLEIEKDVSHVLGVRVLKAKTPTKLVFKKDGTYRANVTTYFADAFDDPSFSVAGAYSRVAYQQIRPTMYGAVKVRLMQLGWIPTMFTEKGSPRTPSASDLEDFANRTGNKGLVVLAKYGSIANRRNIIKSWIAIANKHGGYLPAGAFTNGTNTGRFKHTVVVNVPRAESDKNGLVYYPEYQGKFFGTEMRSLFYAGEDPDYVMVGADAAGLELRCLAHFLNNEDFTETVLDGDVHTLFWDAAGRHMVLSRSDQKSVTYAWLYGAGDMKLATLCTAKQGKINIAWGKEVRHNLLSNVDGLGQLVDLVVAASERGYLRGLDGRKIYMRRGANGKVQTHKALNTLLQSTGGVLVKYWTKLVDDKIKELDIRARQIIHMHDEFQFICHKDDVTILRNVMLSTMIEAGEFFELNIPLAADVQVGANWAETH